MRIIVATLTGLIALATVSAQAANSTDHENWTPVGAALSLALGDQGCAHGWHQTLRRDWRGDWWWGPCAPDK